MPVVDFKLDLFFTTLILLRNGSVLGANIWISILKLVRNENSKFNINCAVEQTLHSLITLFFGTPCKCLEGVWKWFENCLEGVWQVSGDCLKGV